MGTALRSFPEPRLSQKRTSWSSQIGWKNSRPSITFTAPLINQAKVVEFLIAGADKSAALFEVLEGSGSAEQYPSKMIHPVSGQLFWLVDQSAAASLSRKSA